MTTTPNTGQDLVLVVGDDTPTSFRYMAPESGSYLGVCIDHAIEFKAPLRLTGTPEAYRIPNPYQSDKSKDYAVVTIDQDGKYSLENAPSFRVKFSADVFANEVPPGIYLGKVTGSRVTFGVLANLRCSTTHIAVLPNGDAVKGVDIPALVQISATVPELSESEIRKTYLQIAASLDTAYRGLLRKMPTVSNSMTCRGVFVDLMSSELERLRAHDHRNLTGYEVNCVDESEDWFINQFPAMQVVLHFGTETRRFNLSAGVQLTGRR